MSLFRDWLEKMAPPTSEKFFSMLKEQAEAAREMARLLKEGSVSGALGTPEFTAKAHMQERKVDELMDRIMHSVRHTMIHPVDPDDLREMAYSLDSTVDTIDHFVWRMEAYGLKASESMKEMIAVLDEMISGLPPIFDLLLARRFDEAHDGYQKLSDLEEGMDRMFHNAVRRIHTAGEKCYTVEDEVLAILERCADQCTHVGRAVVVMLERNS